MPPKSRGPAASDVARPTRRVCGTDEVNERLLRTRPGYLQARNEIENRTARVLTTGAALRTGCTEIPVVVHVVYRETAENIPDEQIHSQITTLNEDYRARNADAGSVPAAFAGLVADARITFALATTDPDGNATDGITRTSTQTTAFLADTDNVKATATGGIDPWPADRYLNIWVCGNLQSGSGQGLLGYAQFPGGPAETDGVVIVHTAFGSTGTASAPFDLGRTATHEIGHWLNLRHIWGDDGTGCAGSDFVADTPNQGGPNYGTPTFPTISCNNGPNGDLFMNYMDYVDDAAMYLFTPGQVDRMQAALDGPRSSIGTSGPCDVLVKPIVKDIGKEPTKELGKDIIKEPVKDPFKEGIKDLPKEIQKETPKDLPKDPPKDFPKDNPKDFTKDVPKDLPKDPPKDFPKDNPKDLGKDGHKDLVKDGHKDPIKDRPKEFTKEFQKDRPKDLIKDGPKEFVKDLQKDLVDDLPKELLDQQKNVGADVPIPEPGPWQQQWGQQGATPFVLGGQPAGARGDAPCAPCGDPGIQAGTAAAQTDPLLPVVQALGGALAGMFAQAAAGRMDAATAARWQTLAAVYAQLVALLT
ncbi:zinc metalloprotease [Nakamurella alba]|uniref:zinc metalloprotease n=1 Tax=Nakamurella alba TaxID=2665158 RepID=UPI001E5AB8EF|nr:zinc metalloprotease [Nakamurella alba]